MDRTGEQRWSVWENGNKKVTFTQNQREATESFEGILYIQEDHSIVE